MSTIFSDPGWRRGTTLLNNEVIDYDDDAKTIPTAGKELVGQVKVFQDVSPSSGKRFSNRLVYCVAARYKGNTVTDASTIAGSLYVFTDAAPMSEFSALATATNATAGKLVGVLDEYLTGSLRTDDIVWLVVKGPTSVKQTAVSIASGAAIQASATAGSVAVLSSGVAAGQQITGAATPSTAGLIRVNMHSDEI